jgi:hypothetical protein
VTHDTDNGALHGGLALFAGYTAAAIAIAAVLLLRRDT